MTRDIDRAEIEANITNLKRRGEYAELQSEAAEQEANVVGKMLLADAELTDEDVDLLIGLISADEGPVSEDEAKRDLSAVETRLGITLWSNRG